MVLPRIIPYFLLCLAVFAYLFYRRRKLGPVLMKVNRVLLSAHNADSFILIILFVAVSIFLFRLELRENAPSPWSPDYMRLLSFYILLLAAFTAREMERPQLRQRGVSSPRGFHRWEQVCSYHWQGQVLTLYTAWGKKTRPEVWLVASPRARTEINRLLKRHVHRTGGRKKR